MTRTTHKATSSTPFRKLKRRIKHGLKSRLITRRMSKANIDIRDTIILFSDPRSGSTWLMDMLQQIPGTAVIFEPEHWKHGLLDPKLKFGAELQFIPEDAKWPEAQEEFEKILLGHKLNKWSDQHTNYDKWMIAEQIIVKFVRANTFIPWLINQFDFKYKPIHLLRHPMAVAHSRINNFKEDQSFEPFAIPDQPYNEYLIEHEAFLLSLKSNLEVQVAIWCLNNRTLLEKENASRFIQVHYEDLMLQPEIELRRIFKELSIPFPAEALTMINKPSVTDFRGDMKPDPRKQIKKWLNFYSEQQQHDAQRVLDYFGIKEYQASSSSAITAIQRSA